MSVIGVRVVLASVAGLGLLGGGLRAGEGLLGVV